MIYKEYFLLNEDQKKQYIASVQEAAGMLDGTSKRFVQTVVDVLVEEVNSKPQNQSYLIERLLPLADGFIATSTPKDEFFPESSYPALDVLIGERNRELFLAICRQMRYLPYPRGWYRKMFRSSDYRHHLKSIFACLLKLIALYIAQLDTLAFLNGEVTRAQNDKEILPPDPFCLMAEINLGNATVIEIVKEVLRGELGYVGLNTSIICGVIMSNHAELLGLLGKLLIAAKLQEGLRQSICESIDCGTRENFVKLFNLIYENDLLRYSSVKRAVMVITGLGESAVDHINKKLWELIYRLCNEPQYANKLLESTDNVELYLGLWTLATDDVNKAVAIVEKLLPTAPHHSVLLFSYFVNFLQDAVLKRRIAHCVLRIYPDDLEVAACYINNVIDAHSLFSFIGDRTDWWEKSVLEEYFSDRETALSFFAQLEHLLTLMPTKEKKFVPCIFPWYGVTISKAQIAMVLAKIALLLPQELTDRVCPYIGLIYYSIDELVKVLLGNPTSAIQQETILSLLAQGLSLKIVTNIAQKHHLVLRYPREIEHILRLKSGVVRTAALDLLYEQPENLLVVSVQNLLQAKDIRKRLGGLDLLVRSKKDKKLTAEEIQQYVLLDQKPSAEEQLLIDELLSANSNAGVLSNLYDTQYAPVFSVKCVMGEVDNANVSHEIAVGNTLQITDIFFTPQEELLSILEKWNALVIRYEDYEYKDEFGSKHLISECVHLSLAKDSDGQEYKLVPLAEVWEQFYKEEIGSIEKLYQLRMLVEWHKEAVERFRPLLQEMFGIDVLAFSHTLSEKGLKYCNSHWKATQVVNLLCWLCARQKEELYAYAFEVAKAVLSYLYQHFDAIVQRYKLLDGIDQLLAEVALLRSMTFGRGRIQMLDKDYGIRNYATREQFVESFGLRYKLYQKCYALSSKERKLLVINNIDPLEFAYAVQLGIIATDELYRHICEREACCGLMRSAYDRFFLKKRKPETMTWFAFCKPGGETILKEVIQRITDFAVEQELKRGDTPTQWSEVTQAIGVVYGVQLFVRILLSLGKETLLRTTFWYGADTSRRSTLSHLLHICYPTPDDTGQKLRDLLQQYPVTDDRLIQAAMYAPQWIPILQDYFGWEGFASACYYFQAHICDVNSAIESAIARYSPIALEDFENGAVDIAWFQSAYKELGEKRFMRLYENAKYVSDGAKHSRARIFANAMTGKIALKECETKICDKRNKDLVISYGLIPLTPNNIHDVLERYHFLQRFLKEAKGFGALRRASETRAVSIALDNLARTAGYSDTFRFTLAIETELINDLKRYFTPAIIEGVACSISMDATGNPAIVYERDGKPLKTLPTVLKRNTYILELKKVQTNLKEQYSRTRKMFEEAMTMASTFYVHELETLLQNPVVAPMLSLLVFKEGEFMGFYARGALTSVEGVQHKLTSESALTIAHPLDFYRYGVWSAFQRYLFEKQLCQPFKQVFRELYLKTVDELEGDYSLRYAGYQVQPNKIVATLKTRGWVVEAESGLQKIFYKENIIGQIYALADWFSPADIEAPTIEYVVFCDRKTGRQIKLADVPERLFSEVMRDVDLGVSVAYVGGVDPETSASVVELRKAIIENNIALFKLSNVTFSKTFAIVEGKRASYSVHLGSGVVHQKAGAAIHVLPVHSQHRGRLFLPFVDDDPKTAEIMTKVLFFAEDMKIKDPYILEQISR